MKRNKFLLTGFHFPHHSENSGYDQLRNYLQADYIDAGTFPFFRYPFGTNPKRLNMLLFDLFLKYKVPQYSLVHHLYPENHLIYSVATHRKTKVVTTLHLPVQDFFEKPPENSKDIFLKERRKKVFSRVDSIIVLSSEEKANVQAIFPKVPVSFIPHGVNNFQSFFTPISSMETFNVCTIGYNFRDLTLYEQVVRKALNMYPNWCFHLIGVYKQWKDRFENLPNVIIYPYLSEQEYLTLLAKCHVNFLPLTKATANNVLMEAHSVGTLSLVSYLPAIEDYRLQHTFLFKNFQEAFVTLENISNFEVVQLNQLKASLLQESSKFHWENIAQNILSLYSSL
jgi:glycosyltransferase involved in cell wall biosynthesis